MNLSTRGTALKRAAAALAVLTIAAGTASAGEAVRITTESLYKEDASYSTAALEYALNGDINRDGLFLRIFGGYGQYDYDTPLIAGSVDTDVWLGDVGIGYQTVSGGLMLTAFVGVGYENYDQSPRDPTNSLDGSEWGVKGGAEVETVAGSPIYFDAVGSYSSGFDTYFARGRVGANLGNGFILGPEVGVLGNEETDQIRYGAFLAGLPTIWSLLTNDGSKMTIAVGYAESDNDDGEVRLGDDSIYGSINSTFKF